MIFELKLEFKDGFGEEDEEPVEFVHTLSAPEGFEITGGSIFVENPNTNELQRFTFRIDRDPDSAVASLNVLEDPEKT